jgi:hypothetical protein
MMKKLFVAMLLSAFSSGAFALEPERAWLLDLAGGYTPSILETEGGSSFGGFIGYKFNPYLSVEGGYTSLLKQAKSGTVATMSIYGPEVAGYLTFRINDRAAPFLRAGYSKFAMAQSTADIVTGIQTVYGPSYGIGFQFYEANFLSLRVGYNAYFLETSNDYNVQAGIPVTTSNAYISLLFQFGE